MRDTSEPTGQVEAAVQGSAIPGDGGARRQRHGLKSIVVMWIAGGLWGVQPSLIKASGGEGLTEIEALALVLAAVAGSIGLYLAATGGLYRPTRQQLRFLSIASVAEYAAPLLITFLIAPHVDAGLLTLLISTTPVFTVAIAALVGMERLNAYNVTGCILGILGMGLIVLPADALPSPEMLPWCLAAFSIPLIYSCGSVYVSRAWPPGMSALQIAFGGSAIAALILLPAWIVRLSTGSLPEPSSVLVLSLTTLTATVVVEMILYFYLLQTAGPVFTSFTSFVMILSGFIAGALLFGERPSLWIWGAVILFSLSLVLSILAPHPDAAGGHGDGRTGPQPPR